MKTELQVVNKLIDVIVGKINSYLTEDTEHSYLLERIDYKNTEMNYPDIDNMRKNTMFYIYQTMKKLLILN